MKNQIYCFLVQKCVCFVFVLIVQMLFSCSEQSERDNPFDPQFQSQLSSEFLSSEVLSSFQQSSSEKSSSSSNYSSGAQQISSEILSSSVQVSSSLQSSSNSKPCDSLFTDARDSLKYKARQIGSSCWMVENLNYGKFVQEANSSQFIQALGQKLCYNDVESNCFSDGALYQWPIANSVCPENWHLPSRAEWDSLQSSLGGEAVAGYKMKLKTMGTASWKSITYNDGNSSGFSALPAGVRGGSGGFFDRTMAAYFWESTESSQTMSYYRSLNHKDSVLYRTNSLKVNGFSVRCVRNP
jgi:uncharacterized protein (TIGR02145 family)